MRPGELLGDRYRLGEPLGRGGMSVVWRAYDERLGRAVAVKTLARAAAASPEALARVRAEAMAVAKLRHPNIVDVHDYGEVHTPGSPPYPYVVMELVEGASLAALLRDGPLAWPVAVPVCADVAAALAAAHERGIVHRDVTPGNVMLTRDGAKLVDFGISAAIGDAEVTPDGSLLGTPAYLAPERLDREVARPATDVYALGLLLYKTLTGRLPWRSTTTAQMLAAHRYVDPAPLPPIAGLPPAIAMICHRCLAKHPAHRPTSAELARELAAYVPMGRRTVVSNVRPTRDGETHTLPSGWIRPAHIGMGYANVGPAHTAPANTSAASSTSVNTASTPFDRAGTAGLLAPFAASASAVPVSAGSPVSAMESAVTKPLAGSPPRRRRAVRFVMVGLVLLAAAGGAALGAKPRPPEAPGGGIVDTNPPAGIAAGPNRGGVDVGPQAGGTPSASNTALPNGQPVRCQIGIYLRRYGSDFIAAMAVTNHGPVTVDPWRLDFTFPIDGVVISVHPGHWRQAGEHISVYGGVLRARDTVTVVVNGAADSAGRGIDLAYSRFRLNGSACAARQLVDDQPPTVDNAPIVPANPRSPAEVPPRRGGPRVGGTPTPEPSVKVPLGGAKRGRPWNGDGSPAVPRSPVEVPPRHGGPRVSNGVPAVPWPSATVPPQGAQRDRPWSGDGAPTVPPSSKRTPPMAPPTASDAPPAASPPVSRPASPFANRLASPPANRLASPLANQRETSPPADQRTVSLPTNPP